MPLRGRSGSTFLALGRRGPLLLQLPRATLADRSLPRGLGLGLLITLPHERSSFLSNRALPDVPGWLWERLRSTRRTAAAVCPNRQGPAPVVAGGSMRPDCAPTRRHVLFPTRLSYVEDPRPSPSCKAQTRRNSSRAQPRKGEHMYRGRAYQRLRSTPPRGASFGRPSSMPSTARADRRGEMGAYRKARASCQDGATRGAESPALLPRCEYGLASRPERATPATKLAPPHESVALELLASCASRVGGLRALGQNLSAGPVASHPTLLWVARTVKPPPAAVGVRASLESCS